MLLNTVWQLQHKHQAEVTSFEAASASQREMRSHSRCWFGVWPPV